MPKDALPLPELSKDQKSYIDSNWDKQDLRTLCQNVWSNPALTLRDIESKAVKGYIALIGGNPNVAGPKDSSLSFEQQQYIQQNYKNSPPLEMARTLFGSKTLTLASRATMAVVKYCQLIDPSHVVDEEPVDGRYEPPRSIIHLTARVNEYAINPRGDGKPVYDSGKLSSADTRALQALMAYMRTPLFKVQADKYMRKRDRELFESEFIKLCWDKPDLLAEELNQYIAYSAETVKYMQIERTVQLLDERLNEALVSGDGNTVKMNEVELLNSVREKSNASMKQQASLLKTLIGDRAKRINDKVQANSSLLILVEMWKKEDDRRRIIALADKRNDSLAVEVERLSSIEALKAEIYGLNPNTIVR